MSPFRRRFPWFYFDPAISTLVRDEQGSYSMARISFIVFACLTIGLIIADATGGTSGTFKLAAEAWALLSAVDLAIIGWAAGPRIAQYLLPQIGAVAQGIAAAGKSRDPREPDPLKDDER